MECSIRDSNSPRRSRSRLRRSYDVAQAPRFPHYVRALRLVCSNPLCAFRSRHSVALTAMVDQGFEPWSSARKTSLYQRMMRYFEHIQNSPKCGFRPLTMANTHPYHLSDPDDCPPAKYGSKDYPAQPHEIYQIPRFKLQISTNYSHSFVKRQIS